MCYAIPGKVKEIDERIVTVDYFGEEKKAINELRGLCVGDYIYAQGGYVIEKISPTEAQSILSVWKETFFELQEVDLRLSKIDLEKEGIDRQLSVILDKALENAILSKKDLTYLFAVENKSGLELIYKTANFLRQKHLKNSCCVHGIIEISNCCSQACSYCGIATNNITLKRYRMQPQEIIASAVLAVEKYGFRALVLQSGEDAGYAIDELVRVVEKIKQRVGAFICVSFGEVGVDNLSKLYRAGARGLLMRFETSNSELYQRIHPGSRLDSRLLHLEKAAGMGYLIMTGGLIGLPGQEREDVINDIFLAKALGAEMFSFGPFLPHPQTPLANCPSSSQEDVLKVLALARFVNPKSAKILVTSAFETLSPDARTRGLLAGANSVMLNITPLQYREKYSIYPNRVYAHEPISKQVESTVGLLRSLGRAPTDLGVAEKI